MAGHILRLQRKTRTYSNELGARIRQNKEGEAEEDIAMYIQRRPGRDGCQLIGMEPAGSPVIETDGDLCRLMLQEEQAVLSK